MNFISRLILFRFVKNQLDRLNQFIGLKSVQINKFNILMTQQVNQTSQQYSYTEDSYQHNLPRNRQKQSVSDSSSTFSFIFDFLKLYSYAQKSQKIAIALGIILGICSGVSHPLFLYLWFEQLNLAINNQDNLSPYLADFRIYLYYFIALGCGVLIINSLLFGIWKYVSRAISKKIRIKYLQEFIRLTLPQLQKRNGYEWSNEFKTHTLNIEKSIGDKVALFLNLIGIVISGVTSAFIIRWTFSFYMLFITPLGIVILTYFIYIQVKKKEINVQSNKQAENKALQATSMIKTVKMLNGQEKEAFDYQQKLNKGEKLLKKYNIRLGVATGLFYFVQYLFFGVGFLMGIQCVKGTDFCPVSTTGSRYKINQFLSVFFQIFFCTYNFLQLGSNYTLIKSAIQSSKKINAFIDQRKIDRNAFQTQHPNNIEKIIFTDVSFEYPLNPQSKILQDLTIQFLPSKFNAIVGTTGSGKSTIIQLLLKQYYPSKGQILIDDVNLHRIKTEKWLDQIGIVTQEPVLFDGTIKENVLVGKADATDEEVINALIQANIYDFVNRNAEGLEFQIGVGGSKLSGGQKQRIAIARALIKNPKLLILDEATSALDPTTEQQIQSALQDIRKALQNSITIICIAHRITTIKNADKIFLISKGRVVEQGLFKELQYFKNIQENDRKINHQILPPLKESLKKSKQKIPKNKQQNIIQFQQNNQRNEQLQISNKNKQRQKQSIQLVQVKTSQGSIYPQILQYTIQHKLYALCLFLAIIIGGTHLASSILISYHVDQLNRFFLLGKSTNWCENYGNMCSNKLDQYFIQSQKYLYGLIGLAIFTFFPYFLQINLLSKIENEIAFNLKKSIFNKILNFQVKFFQKQQNESGGAASEFGNDSRDASTLISTYLPILICNFCIALGAVIVCFCFDWRFGLLSLIVTPLISLSFYIAMLFIGGYQDSSLQKLHKSDQTANELITCIKTVLVLNYQNRFLQKYKKQINEPFEETIKVGGKIGFLYGLAFFILDISVGFSLYISVVILQAHPQIQPISICIYMIVSTLSGFIIGNNFYFIAHTSASKEAADRIRKLGRVPSQEEVQSKYRNQMVKISPESIIGKIQFRNICFRYKKDDSRLVLNNVSLTIHPGKKVAFVGESGCGKSTILQLLLRFYEFQGEILVNGVNIYDYDLKQYRNIFSMLNQQPSLFAGSIEQNIKYNKSSIQINQERLNEICDRACAYAVNQFQSKDQSILGFRLRRVGPKGSNISGGEKQRVACARALARNSQIFLMDEGTSALDRYTQIKVQKGVNEQFKGKTVITVAHRIQTIKDSDQVFVFNNGEVVQFGKPGDLIKKKRHYYNFVNAKKLQD